MKPLQKFARLIKVDESARQVSGIVTAEIPDRDNEICDYRSTNPTISNGRRKFPKPVRGAT